jgi:hypothetical protein
MHVINKAVFFSRSLRSKLQCQSKDRRLSCRLVFISVTTNNYDSLTELHTPKFAVTTAHIKSSQSSLAVAWQRLTATGVLLIKLVYDKQITGVLGHRKVRYRKIRHAEQFARGIVPGNHLIVGRKWHYISTDAWKKALSRVLCVCVLVSGFLSHMGGTLSLSLPTCHSLKECAEWRRGLSTTWSECPASPLLSLPP